MENSSADKDTHTNREMIVQSSTMYSDTVHAECTDKDGEKMQQSAKTTNIVIQDGSKKGVDLTSDTIEENWQQDAMLQFGMDIYVPDESDSEPENDFPTFFIHELNEC